MIAFENVSKSFGDKRVLDAMTLDMADTCQTADIAKTKHSRAVCDNSHKICTSCKLI